jgi:predicted GIY-YIG superfamily endonuclease
MTPPVVKKRRRKHSESRIDWLGAHLNCPTDERETSSAYIIENAGKPYVGHTKRVFTVRLAEHNSGNGGKYTKSIGPGWKMALVVGGFNCKTAASRFESLVKKRGAKAGVQPKIDAAVRVMSTVGKQNGLYYIK